MKLKISLSGVTLAIMVSAFSQKPLMELTFTGADNNYYVQLDSIKVINQTRGDDTVMFYPDTVLVLSYYMGLHDQNDSKDGLQLFLNCSNPVMDQTNIMVYIPEKNNVNLIITDVLGRKVISTEQLLDKGYHSFDFTSGSRNLFFFTVKWKNHCRSIKILHSGSDSHSATSLKYIGRSTRASQLKTTEAVQTFSFHLGDTLLYIGYANALQSGIIDVPENSEDYTFQFATNIPCPGTPTVTYEGQVYNTIQIFSQCWLKENLNVGTMINSYQFMENNGIIEKYCYGGWEYNCTDYGGLYQWDEMMQYTTTQGVQGICPPDWHIPTDEEWKVLEGCVDSQYGVGDTVWDSMGDRGFDAGLNLKSTWGWYSGGNGTDLFGFSGLPGGDREFMGGFAYFSVFGFWWSSSEIGTLSLYRSMIYAHSIVSRGNSIKYIGMSVRCVRDY